MAISALNIIWTDINTGKKGNTKINYINPTATATTLKQLALKLNALTTNTYVETNKTETSNIDTEGE